MAPVHPITIAAAAERIGVSVWTIRRRIADGTLRAHRVKNSRAIRLDLDDVDALLVPMSGPPPLRTATPRPRLAQERFGRDAR